MVRVRELIEKLKMFDQDLPVMVEGYKYGVQPEMEIIVSKCIQEYPNDYEGWGGRYGYDTTDNSNEYGQAFQAVVILRGE